ncbi:class I SAM-dependent methyltransferase [Kribbella sp. NPDC051770]|uniref:class I SAM-dependent methyltransferase n=1 Tax=Kribbella sp. NPDC051770 TaxID=3155413 RepID=UPI003431663F
MSLANRLTSTNLTYRRPDVYDHLADGGDDLINVVGELTNSMRPRSVLDLGCGTGRHLAVLRTAFGCEGVGIDVQPGLIEYGRAVHRQLDLRQGDIRSIRLGRRFDVVLCLGNSLAYNLSDADLRATIETFGCHTQPGGVLLIGTMLRPPLGSSSGTVDNALITADVESETSWDADCGIATTRRVWRHRDGRRDQDFMQRRVTPFDELAPLLKDCGFVDVAVFRDNYVAGRKA